MRTLFTYKQTRLINGHEIEFEINEAVGEDDIDPAGDFDFGDPKENEAYLQRFKSGELFIGVIRVTATSLGFEGTDYLGACHLHAVQCGDDSKLKIDVAETIKEHSMVEKAIEECIEGLQETAKKLAFLHY